ncbi:MAG: CBS domain-containing protein [Mariprofundales bacterium]
MHYIHPETSLEDAFLNTTLHAVPVVENAKLIGLLLMRDVLAVFIQGKDLKKETAGAHMQKQVVTVGNSPNILQKARMFSTHRIKTLITTNELGQPDSNLGPDLIIDTFPSTVLGFFQPVRNIMISSVLTSTATTSMTEAMQEMVQRRLSCMVICENKKVIGMISESDFLRNVHRNDLQVSDIMTSDVQCVSDHYNLGQVWADMKEYRVMKMPVVNMFDELCGLLTTTDLLVALSNSLLQSFARHHCPEGVDMLVEWNASGMVMAVSNRVLEKLACLTEDLVGLQWENGCDADKVSMLLACPKNISQTLEWTYMGRAIKFVATRDREHATMSWVLEDIA